MAKRPPTKPASKTESSDKSADEAAAIVAFAKTQGIDISHVHEEVNRLAAERQKAAASVAAKAAPERPAQRSKKRGGAAGKKRSSKTAYVLGLPNLSARDIVAKAKAEGIVISDQYVYNIRSLNGSKSPRKTEPSKPLPDPVASPQVHRAAGPTAVRTDSQSQLIHAALDMGLARAEALLRELRKRLTEL